MRVIAGSARSLPLKTVPGLCTRPTTDRTKETLFNILMPDLPSARFLDLFAGSGGIGIEALSRGASYACFAERDRKACACIRENLAFTRLADRAEVLESDVIAAIGTLERRGTGPFDIVFMDPPYREGLEQAVLERLHGSPLVTDRTLLVFEASIDTDISFAEGAGYRILRDKRYKTNRHVFLEAGKG
ncbi:MAG: 16S rRNA (guanine(966)-N(2))-methyltransferase RsmD [Lachnospiraceae bacterium]|nr:16S rRNA (guanine(966)-N(2))-methyltransferase RsmD [Lachnospiraceae bacterium]MBP5255247.1 16S rRNA (guanine(966)-N(2))-methyltransferase RsmD [Lachnospiraceae bacterium]